MGGGRLLAYRACRHFLAMMISPCRRRLAEAALPIPGRDRGVEQSRASLQIQPCPTVVSVGLEPAACTCFDDLLRSRSRVDEAIGRIVASELSGPQIEHRYAGPVVTRRRIDHRHAAAYRSAVPVCVVDEDLAGA